MPRLRYIFLAVLMVPAAASANKWATNNYDEFDVTDIAREQMFTASEKACETKANDEISLILACYSKAEKRFEKMLNNNYRKVMARTPRDKRIILRDQQRQWLASREYQCETASPISMTGEMTQKCHMNETYRRALWLVAHDTSGKGGII